MQSSEKRKKMNIYDIAKEAGVSISTVSRVMNNKGNVNAATRKKIRVGFLLPIRSTGSSPTAGWACPYLQR